LNNTLGLKSFIKGIGITGVFCVLLKTGLKFSDKEIPVDLFLYITDFL